MQEWFSASELAAAGLPSMPATERAVQIMAKREGWAERRNLAGEPLARPRAGRGGGTEYHYSVLPSVAQVALVKRGLKAAPRDTRSAAKESIGVAEMWAAFERLPDKRKSRARARLDALEAVKTLEIGGMGRDQAVMFVAAQRKVGLRSIYRWFDEVAGVERGDWLPYLAPRHTGRTVTAECDAMAYEFYKTDYLRPEKPSAESCYRRLRDAAAAHGWTIPSAKTLMRRIEREIAWPVIVLSRQGPEALKRLYPAQERDRSVFHALEAVNADGHKWDVRVEWEDGSIDRPVMVAIQDLYSGKFLSWRIDRSENKEAVRLAIGDMVELYGIPDHIYLDNGRSFASKWLTGGTPNRYRFKVRDDEPSGILTDLGVTVHWTTPYAGQSKPIERAFRDFCDNIAKHPAFAGAYTGNSPMAKPSNYGSKAVPIDSFRKVVAQGIAEHNARPGRRTRVAAGRSFDEAFRESYEKSPIKTATAEKRRLWLLAAEGVSTSSADGSVRLLGNRFWAEFMAGAVGQKVIARFDPQDLMAGIHVYRMDGGYLGHAECIEAAGFNDVAAAREHASKRRSWIRMQKEMAALETQLGIEQVAALLSDHEPAPAPEAHVLRIAGNLAVRAAAQPEADPDEIEEDSVVVNLARAMARAPRREL